MLEIDLLSQGTKRPNPTQIMAAQVPALLHPGPKEVLVVGLGAGQTAGRFLVHPSVERLDCVEIEPELSSFVREHFEAEWMDDARFRLIVEDGRNYLAHTDATYDIISLEVGQVFRPALASFYTVDFYRRARRRLNQHGVLAQFVPLEMFTRDEFRSVVRTFLEVFPQSVLWYNRSELLLIGGGVDDLKLSASRFRRAVTDGALQQDLDFSYWGGSSNRMSRPDIFLAGFLAGPDGLAGLAEEGRIYRDDLPLLEYATASGRAIHLEATVELIGGFLEPVEAILSAPMDGEETSRIRSIQRRNLGNIVYNLGARYFNGEGVPQDDAEAVRLFRLAADQGDPTGQANLGNMYKLGRGVSQDNVEAHRWYDLAIARAADETRTLSTNLGDGVAERMNAERTRTLFTTYRDDLAERMTTEQIAEAQRRARQWAPTVGP